MTPLHTVCPECGSDELVNITPAIPGPYGWGFRCKACGHRWELEVPEIDDDPEQFDRLRQPGFGRVPGVYE